MKKVLSWFINLYAIWIVSSFLLGFYYPGLFEWFKGYWMKGALSVVMLSMGLTLRLEDFKNLFQVPRSVVLGAICQYSIMPLSGYVVATSLGLSGELAVGLILVASCPGGTASNMIAYIARANLALAVVTTMVSTVLGIVMTPLWCKILAGQYVPVDAWGMVLDMFLMVMIPVGLGVFINYKFPDMIQKMGQAGPVISTWAIILISGGIIAPVDKGALVNHMGILVLAATLLHLFGFGLGYAVPKLFRFDDKISKAISIETGMQNGGLAGILAKSHFPRMEQVNGSWINVSLAPVPAVFCSIAQTIIGGVIGTIWRFTDKENNHG